MQSTCNCLTSFDCDKEFKLLGKERKTFTQKRIVVFHFTERTKEEQLYIDYNIVRFDYQENLVVFP